MFLKGNHCFQINPHISLSHSLYLLNTKLLKKRKLSQENHKSSSQIKTQSVVASLPPLIPLVDYSTDKDEEPTTPQVKVSQNHQELRSEVFATTTYEKIGFESDAESDPEEKDSLIILTHLIRPSSKSHMKLQTPRIILNKSERNEERNLQQFLMNTLTRRLIMNDGIIRGSRGRG